MRNRSRSLVPRLRSGSRKRRNAAARSSSPRRFSLGRNLMAQSDNSSNTEMSTDIKRKEMEPPKRKEMEPPTNTHISQVPTPPKRPTLKWKSVVDPATGRLYYYHRVTRVSTWSRPKDFFSDERPESPVKTQSFPTQLLARRRSTDSFEEEDEILMPRPVSPTSGGGPRLSRSLSFASNGRMRSPETTQADNTQEEKGPTESLCGSDLRTSSSLTTMPIQNLASYSEKGNVSTKEGGQPRLSLLPVYQEPEEVMEGQEVLLIQKEEAVIEEEEDCEESEVTSYEESSWEESSSEEEEEEGAAEQQDIHCENQQIEVQRVPTASVSEKKKKKKKSRFLRRRATKKKDASTKKQMNVKVEAQTADNNTDDQDDASASASASEKPQGNLSEKSAKAKKETYSPGRVVLLPTKHSMQEAAWNEEQARRLLLKALHTTNMDRRKELCQQAFDHAHDAVELRHEAQDEKIGLVIDAKHSQAYPWSRHFEDESTLTLSTVSATTLEETLLSKKTNETSILDRVQALQAMDHLCGACIVDDDSVGSFV